LLDETAIRADYLQGLANLRSGEDLDGPDKGMERDIHTALYESPSYCAVALVELINKFGLDAQGNPKGDEDGAESL
jgi:hypothetical protein